MASRQTIHIPPITHRNPVPMAARVGGLICTSAVFGADQASGVIPESVAEQVVNVFRNLKTVLAKANATPENVVQLRIRIKDQSVSAYLNEPWLEMFPDENNRPARLTMVEPTLALMVQIDAIAFLQQ